MKQFILGILLITILCNANAQVAISSNGSQPHPSAILDLKSSNKGVLLPRVSLTSTTDSITIPHPEPSLIVYNTNPQLEAGLGLYIWAGDHWGLVISAGNKYIKGKNRFTTLVDGDTREYWVHVPTLYDSTVAVPLVFMLHGTSGWKELGEEENFISVFPSSWRYKIYDFADSVIKNTTKWNTVPDADWTFVPGYTGRDDIKFLKKIILEMRAKFNIDTSRIYMNGFSNGGQMASKCAIEMSHIFAAVASNAATFFRDTVYVPQRKLPVLFQIGNEDYGPGNTGPAVPLDTFNYLISTPNLPFWTKYYKKARRYIENFGLDSVHAISGDTESAMIAGYHSLTNPTDTLNVFRYVFVKGLAHQYPNGDNHWMEAARLHWAWMRRYRKP
jgi:predicted esterase